MAKRASEDANGSPAKVARKTGDDPLEARKAIFAAGGLMADSAPAGSPGCWTLVAPGIGSYAASPPLELSYFAIRGLGQLPQLFLEVAGYPYRYTVVTGPYFKEHLKAKLVFGRLPTVRTLGGTEIAQSQAVKRYVAKVSGLAGETDAEAARCDMLHEMFLTEAKVEADEVKKFAVGGKTVAGASGMKAISRVELSGQDAAERTVTALKFWEDMLCASKATGAQWLLGGLGDGGNSKLCYVDIALFWSLRSCASELEQLGCKLLVQHLKNVSGLEGFKRLVESGRLMPDMAEGYVYREDDLVKKP